MGRLAGVIRSRTTIGIPTIWCWQLSSEPRNQQRWAGSRSCSPSMHVWAGWGASLFGLSGALGPACTACRELVEGNGGGSARLTA
jgi:hypothetical protein